MMKWKTDDLKIDKEYRIHPGKMVCEKHGSRTISQCELHPTKYEECNRCHLDNVHLNLA